MTTDERHPEQVVLEASEDNPEKPLSTAWKRIGTFLRSRFLIMILIVLLAGSLIFFQTASLQLATSTDNLIERENGIYRQLTVYAPRGILTNRYGQPVAYNVSTHVLYLANAGLEDDELNRMLLDLTDFLDARETPYDNSLEDYLAVDPIRFTDDMSEIRYWQQSVLGLKAGKTEAEPTMTST